MKKATVIAQPGQQQIIVTRDFDAPLKLVYKVFTDPELIPQWWGPSYLTTQVEKMETRPGGMWRFIQHDTEGKEYPFHGVYHQVSPEQIVYTFEYEGVPGHVALETIRLEEREGKTRMTDITVFQSIVDRDGMLQEGMEEGMDDSYERMDQLLARL
jgi:uncharacterized protein YndB with AHSA1/START domain